MKRLFILFILVGFVIVLGMGCVSATSNFTTGDIASASVSVKNQIETNNALPSSVVINGQTVNTAQYLHLAVQATDHVNSNNTAAISLSSDTAPSYQEEQLNTGSMSKADYVDFAQRIDGYMDDNHQAPPYGWAGPGKISYSSQVYLFSRVLTIYNCSGTLPPQITMKSWSTGNIPITESQSFNFTPNQIVSAANVLNTKIESTKSIPSTVTVAGVNINTAQFLHLAVQATNQIKNNNNSVILLSSDSIPGSQQEQLNGGSMSKSDYVDFAQRIDDYMDNNHQAPPYGLIGLGTIGYSSEIYLFSRILSIYYEYGRLPVYVRIKPWAAANIPIVYNPTTFTTEEIVAASVQLKNTIESMKMVSDVMVGPVSVNIAQYLQLAVLATIELNNNDTSAIPLLDDTAPSSQSESLNIGVLSKSDYIDFAQRINDYIINNNNQAPSYGLIGLGTMRYNNMIYTFSKILDAYNSLNMLPESIDVQPWAYILNPVYNNRTNERFNTIQAAINDTDTHDGDTLTLGNITYTENVIVSKVLKIIPLYGNVVVQGLDSSIPVFTINSSGSGSIIMNLIIKGCTNNAGILINNSMNNTIQQNNITGNQIGISLNNATGTNITYNTINNNSDNGIYIESGSNNTIYQNTLKYNTAGVGIVNSQNNGIISNIITNTTGNGVYLGYSDNNTIQRNEIISNYYGICLVHSNNTGISENNIVNNTYGVNLEFSSATIQFNRIAENSNLGLYSSNSTVNATNNWWGFNTDPTTTVHGIYSQGGSVNCTPWLVLGVNLSSINSGGNTSITADLTHNNQGGDTSSQGHIPNGVPINFTSTFGTVVGTTYTVKGKASTILNLSSLATATVTATASLDNQNVNTTTIISIGVAVLNITSTAIDNSTGLPLNTTYNIPLNESVTWLSVLWINTGMFTDELQIIVDGTVVQDKYFYNTAYTAWQNSYSTSVFNAIIYVNQHLSFIDSTELTTFWNDLTTTYNLTSEELTFVQNHSQEFIDNLTVNIVYSGVPGLNLTVTDPEDNKVININFPGNVINRVSQIVYTGSPGEGVKSFAIATTDVTTNVLQYWWNQYSSYQTGDAMNTAYNTFLTALMVEYYHDLIADNVTTSLNVTWSRTNPVIVSVAEDPYQIYETLESDHSMGMTVIGTIENMWTSNFEISSYIPFIEYEIICRAYNSTFSSVPMELNYLYNNYNTYVETFRYNDFIIIKSKFNKFLVIDLETGIVRDIDTVNNLYGSKYAFGGRTFDYGYFFQPKEPVTTIACKSLIGYRLYVWQIGSPWDLGALTFVWDKQNNIYISGDDMYLVDIRADNRLTITGPKGSMTFEGTHEALDITAILDENVLSQTLSFVVEDTDGGFIGTSPLYIVEAVLEAQNRDLVQVFPNPIPDLLPNADDLPQDPNKEHPVGIPIPLYYDENGRVIWYYVYFEINWNNLYT